jgi:hypothetical protein
LVAVVKMMTTVAMARTSMVHESLNFRLGGTQLSSKRPYSASEAFQEFEVQILS